MEVIGPVLIILILATIAIQIVNTIRVGRERRFLHLERLAAMEKGLPFPDELLADSAGQAPRRRGNHGVTVQGIIWAGLGLGIIVSRNVVRSPEIGTDMRQFMTFLEFWAYPAVIVGLGLLAYAWLIREKK